MCLGIPAKVVSRQGNLALIDAAGVRREVSAALLPEMDPGDYVLIHAGFAIARISGAEENTETARLLSDLPAGGGQP